MMKYAVRRVNKKNNKSSHYSAFQTHSAFIVFAHAQQNCKFSHLLPSGSRVREQATIDASDYVAQTPVES